MNVVSGFQLRYLQTKWKIHVVVPATSNVWPLKKITFYQMNKRSQRSNLMATAILPSKIHCVKSPLTFFFLPWTSESEREKLSMTLTWFNHMQQLKSMQWTPHPHSSPLPHYDGEQNLKRESSCVVLRTVK